MIRTITGIPGGGGTATLTLASTATSGFNAGDIIISDTGNVIGRIVPGSGVATALAINANTAGGFVTHGGTCGTLTGNVSGSSGSCTGNAATATLASTVTVADTTDSTCYVALFEDATGSVGAKTDAGITYNASTGALSVTKSCSGSFDYLETGTITARSIASAGLVYFDCVNGTYFFRVAVDNTWAATAAILRVEGTTDATDYNYLTIKSGATGQSIKLTAANSIDANVSIEIIPKGSGTTLLGTVSSGTWNGTAIGAAYGGTGATTLTAKSLIVGNGTSAVAFLAPGTNRNFVASNGTDWQSRAFALADLPTQADGTCLANVSGSTAVPSAQPFVFRKLDLGGGNYAYAGCDFSGNARGINAIDIQSVRAVGTRVASGSKAVCVGTENTGAGGADTAIGAVNTVSSSGGSNTSIGATNTISGTGLGSVIVGFTNTVSSDYGYSAIVGYNNTISAHYGESVAIGVGNTVSGAYMKWGIAIGDSNTVSGYQSAAIGTGIVQSGDTSYAFGKEVKNTVASVAEIGFFTGSTRNSAIRLHSLNGLVTFTCVNSGTALTDGGTPAGSEANGTLMRNGWSLRRNGYALYIDVNSGGTVKTLSLGTAV